MGWPAKSPMSWTGWQRGLSRSGCAACGVFGGNKPHTLYAGVEESPELRRLQSIHERICQVLGLAAESRASSRRM